MRGTIQALRSEDVPRAVGAAVERALATRGDAAWLLRVIRAAGVPMLMVDDARCYVEVNWPARLLFRLTLEQMRRLTIDDLTPPEDLPTMTAAWERLIENGAVAGPYEVASTDGSSFDVVYCALADALPGLHLIAFAPATWPDEEFGRLPTDAARPPGEALTRRELEILRLAAAGQSGPRIADELFISLGTVRKHFDNLYEKLRVSDRPAAVAKALRLGLID